MTFPKIILITAMLLGGLTIFITKRYEPSIRMEYFDYKENGEDVKLAGYLYFRRAYGGYEFDIDQTILYQSGNLFITLGMPHQVLKEFGQEKSLLEVSKNSNRELRLIKETNKVQDAFPGAIDFADGLAWD